MSNEEKIQNINSIIKECDTVLETQVSPDDPQGLMNHLLDLGMCKHTIGKAIANAEKLLKQKQLETLQLNMNDPATVLRMKVDYMTKDQQFTLTRLDRMRAAINTQSDNTRSTLSFIKEELK